MKEKPIFVGAKREGENQESVDWKEFSEDVKALLDIEGLSVNLVTGIVKEAEILLNTRDAIQRMPSFGTDGFSKYLVAAKNCKRRMYECTVYRDHVTCNCPFYKFNILCKHSLCIAENSQLLKLHIEYFKKSPRRSKLSKSGLVVPEKVAPGKKGGTNRNSWRGSRGKTNPPCSKTESAAYPFTEIHHNDRPLTLCFLSEEPKAKDCRHCRNGISSSHDDLALRFCPGSRRKVALSGSQYPRKQTSFCEVHDEVLLHQAKLRHGQVSLIISTTRIWKFPNKWKEI